MNISSFQKFLSVSLITIGLTAASTALYADTIDESNQPKIQSTKAFSPNSRCCKNAFRCASFSYFYSDSYFQVNSFETLKFDIAGPTNGAVVSSVDTFGGTQFTVQVAGVYEIDYGFVLNSEFDIGNGRIQLNVNGNQIVSGTMRIADPAPNVESPYYNTELLVNLNVGDVVTVSYVNLTGAGTIAIGPDFSDIMGTTITFVKVGKVQPAI